MERSLSRETLELLNALRAWHTSFSSDIVSIQEHFCPLDEYGSEFCVDYLPRNPFSASVTIRCIAGGTPGFPKWAVGLFVDSWQRIASRELLGWIPWGGLDGSRNEALVSEPTPLPLETILDVVVAVAGAHLAVSVAVLRRSLVGVKGRVILSDQAFEMDGTVLFPFPLVRMLGRVGAGEVRPLHYDPWNRDG